MKSGAVTSGGWNTELRTDPMNKEPLKPGWQCPTCESSVSPFLAVCPTCEARKNGVGKQGVVYAHKDTEV